MDDFAGFGPETIAFLTGLAADNSKPWFDAHRADYEAHYLTPAKDFVTAIGPRLQALHPALNAEPRVNGSIFRINRDIRFSKDKTPYKAHLDLWFWEGARKGALSGLFFRLTPDALILGAGAHGFQPPHLKAYRAAVAGPGGEALVALERGLKEDRLPLGGEALKKLPRGFTTDDPDRARLLRHTALHALTETPHPVSLGTPGFVDHCVDRFARVLPVHRWLMDNLG